MQNTARLYQSLDRDKYFARLVQQFKGDVSTNQRHHDYVREMNKILCSSQYTDDKEICASGSEKLQFNMIAPIIRGICGSAINNQRDVAYRPASLVTPEKIAETTEMVGKTASYIRRLAKASVAEREAFRDCITSGIGYVETTIDYSSRRQGEYIIERVRPEQIIYDASAERINLEDAQHLFKTIRLPLWQLAQYFPDVPEEELSANWARKFFSDPMEDLDNNWSGASVNQQARQDLPLELFNLGDTAIKLGSGPEDGRNGIVVCAFWKETLTFYRSKINNMLMLEDDYIFFSTLPEAEWPRNFQFGRKSDWGRAHVTKMTKRVTLKAWLGGAGILGNITAPLCPAGSFPILAVTCYRDDYERRYFGLVESASDPQKLYNKLTSQAVYSLDNSASGGYIVNKAAFINQTTITQFEESITDPGKVTMIDGPLDMVAPKIASPPPEIMMSLREGASSDIYTVMGTSPEFLGQADREQANALEVTRRQSTMNILAEPFDSLHIYMESCGRGILWWIQNVVPEGMIINISATRQMSFSRNDLIRGNFDTIIDDQPAGIDEKSLNWQILKDVMSQCAPLVQAGQMELVRQIVNCSPLPTSMGDRLLAALEKDIVKQQQAMLKQQQSQMQQQQQAINPQASPQGSGPGEQSGQDVQDGGPTGVPPDAGMQPMPPQPPQGSLQAA